jgi:hypothetical protein
MEDKVLIHKICLIEKITGLDQEIKTMSKNFIKIKKGK